MSGFEVQDREVRKMLEAVASPKTSRKLLSAMRKGLNIISKDTTIRFQTNRRGFSGKKVTRRTKNGKEKERILKVAKVVTDNKRGTAKVHIMDDYRVKWFETGTKERKTKGRKITGGFWKGKRKLLRRQGSGHSTGKIRPEWFFRRAVRAKGQESEQKIGREIKRVLSNL